MDAIRRHKTPRSETKDSLYLIARAVTRKSAFYTGSLNYNSCRVTGRRPDDTCTHSRYITGEDH